MTGCSAQSEKNNASAYNTHETSSEVSPEKAPTAGNFTVHYNPATECVRSFDMLVIMNLSTSDLHVPDL